MGVDFGCRFFEKQIRRFEDSHPECEMELAQIPKSKPAKAGHRVQKSRDTSIDAVKTDQEDMAGSGGAATAHTSKNQRKHDHQIGADATVTQKVRPGWRL